ncbi:hypothetical protein [Paenibacillus luteus]|uniref:hypothetical protein n=1 Tax=Paenibacillus luteus TaxID=2545753 RepID=UPI001143D231|nr:hypothetical protein [Paenibacillus luteus]
MDDVFDISKPVSFRLPVDTAQSVQDYLNDLKQQEGRKYGSACASLFVSAINDKLSSASIGGDKMVLHLPGPITSEQREWLETPMTKQILGQWIYQMMTQPGQSSVVSLPGSLPLEQKQDADNSFQIKNKTTSNLAMNLLNDDD